MAFGLWLETKWTRLLVRGGILASPILIAAFWIVWSFTMQGVKDDLAVAQSKVTSVQMVQDARARDGEAFQTEVRGAVADLKDQIGGVKDDVFATKIDVGVIKRLVTEMRQDAKLASASRPDWSATAALP